VRWEDLEDRAARCPRCLHWWVSHGVPGEDGYGCGMIESSMAERTAMAERDREFQRQGVPPEAAGPQAYRDLRYCGCTFAEGNTVTPRQVRSTDNGRHGRPRRDSRPAVPGANQRTSARASRSGRFRFARSTWCWPARCCSVRRSPRSGGASSATSACGLDCCRSCWPRRSQCLAGPSGGTRVLQLGKHVARKLARSVVWLRLPPRAELAEADGLRAFFHVLGQYRRTATLGLADQPDLAGLHVADGVVYVPIGRRIEPRALYRVPTVNLDTASAETRRGARAKWGAVLNGLPHPIQVVIRGRPAATLLVVERIKAYGSAPAKDLAAWLGAHLHGAQLVERERYLVVPAEDLETLSDRCASLEASLRRIGLPMERFQAADELRGVVGAFLTPRPRQFMPAVIDISASGHLVSDGEYVRAFDLGKLPPTIVTDWASPLLDGDLSLDVSIDVEPLDLAWAKLQLDTRGNALESSAPTPGRIVALEQISGLRMAHERRRTLPVRIAITVVGAPQTGTRSSAARSDCASAPRISVPNCGCCAGSRASAGWQSHRCDVDRLVVADCRSRPARWLGRTRSAPKHWRSRVGCRSA
jgi:hypothetical protein